MANQISGSCKTSGSVAIVGATVTALTYPAGTFAGSAITDASGNYAITGLASGDYSLTATLNGWSFQSIIPNSSGTIGIMPNGATIFSADVANINFQGTQWVVKFGAGGTSGSSVASITSAAIVSSQNGNMMVFVKSTAAPTSVTLSNGTTPNLVASFNDGGGNPVRVYIGKSAANGSTTATANFSPNVTFAVIDLLEVADGGVNLIPGIFGLIQTDARATVASGTSVDSNTLNTQVAISFVMNNESAATNGTASTGRGLVGSTLKETGANFARNCGAALVFGKTSSTCGMNLVGTGTNINLCSVVFGWLQNGIRGNCGVGGATVSYSGPRSGSVTADLAGNYYIPFTGGADIATWTITPSAAGVTFTPTNNTVVVSALDSDTAGPSFTGSTTITAGPTATVTDRTVVVAWTTAGQGDSKGFLTGDIWVNKAAVDNGIPAGETAHLVVFTGLKPSTAYSITVQTLNAVSSPINVTTNPEQPRILLSGASVGTPVNNATLSDTFFSCKSNDGTEYMTHDDGSALTNSGTGNMVVGTMTNPTTVAGANVNALPAFGANNSYDGIDDPTNSGSGSTKKWGSRLFGILGGLFGIAVRQNTSPTFYQYRGMIVWSADHGVTWGNGQNVGVANANGIRQSPVMGYSFSTKDIGWAGATAYAIDDGSLGYNTAGNQIDGGNAWVYHLLMSQQALFNTTLMRIPRRAYAVLLNSNGWSGATPYTITPQYWVGPASPTAQDFANDSNWSTTFSGMTQVYASATGWPHITFIPTLNSYVLTAFNATNWVIAAGPTPAGPFTTIYNAAAPNPGSGGILNGECPLHSDVSANALQQNLTFRVTASAGVGTNYHPWVVPMTWTTSAYNITGSVGLAGAGASVNYTGTSSGSVTADALGNYVIPGLANGTYTITPSKTGTTFTPGSSGVQTVNNANITGVNFTSVSTGGVSAADPDAIFQAVGTVTALTASLQIALDGVTWVDYVPAGSFINNTTPVSMVTPLVVGPLYRIHATAVTGSMDFWLAANGNVVKLNRMPVTAPTDIPFSVSPGGRIR